MSDKKCPVKSVRYKESVKKCLKSINKIMINHTVVGRFCALLWELWIAIYLWLSYIRELHCASSIYKINILYRLMMVLLWWSYYSSILVVFSRANRVIWECQISVKMILLIHPLSNHLVRTNSAPSREPLPVINWPINTIQSLVFS